MSSFIRKRDRDEIIELLSTMENEFSRAAQDYRLDAVAQIEGVERGTVADVNEAIHRAVHAIAFIKLAQHLQEIIGIAEGRRSAEKWVRTRSAGDV